MLASSVYTRNITLLLHCNKSLPVFDPLLSLVSASKHQNIDGLPIINYLQWMKVLIFVLSYDFIPIYKHNALASCPTWTHLLWLTVCTFEGSDSTIGMQINQKSWLAS